MWARYIYLTLVFVHKGDVHDLLFRNASTYVFRSQANKLSSYKLCSLFTDYMPEHHAFFSVEEMAAQFPDHGELFKKVARLDVTKDDNYSSRHDEEEDDDHNERDHGRHRGRRGRYSYRSRRRH